tara:strand:- start:2436 stop:2615 length:180 start_codon:yes stop_codon:yes gene_type:complete
MGLPKETKELVETILAMDPTLTYTIDKLSDIYPIPMKGQVWRMMFKEEIGLYNMIKSQQ